MGGMRQGREASGSPCGTVMEEEVGGPWLETAESSRRLGAWVHAGRTTHGGPDVLCPPELMAAL